MFSFALGTVLGIVHCFFKVSSKMGQSSVKELPFQFDNFKDDVLKQAQVYKELAVLTYDEFLLMIKDLNRISQEHPDTNGRNLLFVIKCGSDSSLLWKGTVRVGCLRVLCASKKIEDYRLLNLKQFLMVYKMINYLVKPNVSAPKEVASSSTEASPSEVPRSMLSTSMILDQIGVKESACDMDECCICMERKPEISLPCAHSYCLFCIEQWNVSNKTCPVCRETLENTDDSWVLPEIPESSEVDAELQRALNGITQKLAESVD